MSYQQHGADDLAVRQDLSLKHLMLLEELHLGLQIGQVGFTVLRHLLHPLRHPLLGLADGQKHAVHLYNRDTAGQTFVPKYLCNISAVDTQHPGKLELLPAFDGQLLDPIPSLEEGSEFGLDPSTLVSAQLLLQLLSQLLQREQLEQQREGGVEGGNNTVHSLG